MPSLKDKTVPIDGRDSGIGVTHEPSAAALAGRMAAVDHLAGDEHLV